MIGGPISSRDITRRSALIGLGATVGVSGSAAAQVSLGSLIDQVTKRKPEAPAETVPLETIPAGRQSVVPRGYSEHFVPVRSMLQQGQFESAIHSFALPAEKGSAATNAATLAARTPDAVDKTAIKAISGDAFLANVEVGLIDLENGQTEAAIVHLRAAEDSLAAKSKGSVFRKVGKGASSVMGKIIGRDDLSPYDPLDHEEILQLNYLALAHLLQGQRACYNVARRCIAQQSALKTKFDKQIEESKSKLAQQTSQNSKLGKKEQNSLDSLAAEFRGFDATATRVPNAYVNPLGDYLAGLIQEVASREQPPLRDNSRIAYQNAAKLCGTSPQMTAAALAMGRPRVPETERVLHFIVGEGFAPARNVMTYGLSANGQTIPIRVPIFTPIPSPVDHVEVLVAGGRKLATLDPIGDFEAIRLRDQQDRAPIIMLSVLASGVMSYLTARQANKLGAIGNALSAIRENNASPDTRSWLSLPRRFHVARVVVPTSAKSVQLASFGGGRRLATVPIPILPNETQTVVYARAIDTQIRVQKARRLWIEGRIETEEV